jgi:inhibitor of cysteine peptidase
MLGIKYRSSLFLVGEIIVESRIKRKALLYGVFAILLATTVATVAYKFGAYEPGTETPLTPEPTPPSALFSTFNSRETLRNFLASNSETQGPFLLYGPEDVRWMNTFAEGLYEPAMAVRSADVMTVDYSSTNIQVMSVDEADNVKTDGEYLYVLANGNLLIVKAYPPQAAEVVANVTFGDLHPIGIFVEGDHLTVLGSRYFIPQFPHDYMTPYYIVDIRTFARIYDIQDRANPVLLRDLMLTGSYFNSRMIGNYVYFVVSQPAYVVYDTVVLPKIYSNNAMVKEIAPSEIHYYNGSDNYYQYTTFVAMNIQNLAEAPTYMTIMLGGTSNMYVSINNMYVTFPEFRGNTTIYRIFIQGKNMTAEAKGQVKGNVLNQFSMDEYNGYFRIATATRVEGIPRSNLFILDMGLKTVGKLLDIEVGETLDSARFMANRCYLSTSVVRRDPFFVIDVADATSPKILGYLKIPGFNRYLHPYDENHVIGVGRDESNNVKVSLFGVTDVSSPQLISEYRFGSDWSDTPVLWDHKAFLFAYSKNLLALPVTMEQYEFDGYEPKQGLFVFNITADQGIVLKGSITHQEEGVNAWDTKYHVRRSLYIENVLYTVSDAKIKLNSLESLAFLREVLLA